MSKVNLREIEPADYSLLFSLDGGGRELVEEEIKKILMKKSKINILEVGSYLGHSTVRWLDYDPNVNVIACDLFTSNADVHRRYISRNVVWAMNQYKNIDFDRFVDSLDSKDGHLRCFRSNLNNYLDRIVVYKGFYQNNIDEISKNHDIDLVFLDSDKVEEILRLSLDYFPNAKMTGDDWTWGEGFPMRQAVLKICEENNFSVRADRQTWIIDK